MEMVKLIYICLYVCIFQREQACGGGGEGSGERGGVGAEGENLKETSHTDGRAQCGIQSQVPKITT